MIAVTDADAIHGFLSDASNAQGGAADIVYYPESERDVLEVLAECRRNRMPVTVSGAGTGLAGGRVPVGGAVLATSRMNRILSIDSDNYTAIVQPGVRLGELQLEVERLNRLYPPDPTERSCSVGGTVATNASGARSFKYGPTRAFIQRLRLITSGGELLQLERGQTFASGLQMSIVSDQGRRFDFELPRYSMPNIKHAAGYYVHPDMDAIDLFIGSEGTLGVVTEIETRLIDLPQRIFSGIVFFPEESATRGFVDEARSRSRMTASGSAADIEARALEFMDKPSLELIRPKYHTIPANAHGGAIWFEQESSEERETTLLEEWNDLIVRYDGMIEVSWFALSQEDQNRMRAFRHAIPESVYEYLTENDQVKLGTDMAVPDDNLTALLEFYRNQLRERDIHAVIYGHIGNSHLHVNMLCQSREEHARALEAYRLMVEFALQLGGTISAEHGVGKIKKQYLRMMYGDRAIGDMRRVKSSLDPDGLLGRGTMFEP